MMLLLLLCMNTIEALTPNVTESAEASAVIKFRVKVVLSFNFDVLFKNMRHNLYIVLQHIHTCFLAVI